MEDSAEKRVFCGECGLQLANDADKEPRQPCAKCGSLKRKISLGISTVLGTGAVMLRMKHRRPGKGLLLDALSGERTGTDKRRAKVVQVVDFVRRWYKKHVVLDDGTIVKDVEGPLEDQSLHGHQPPKPHRK